MGFVLFSLRKSGKDNLFRCTYVLPDGVAHTKGFVKDPDEAKRYLTLTDGDFPAQVGTNKDLDQLQVTEKPEDRKRTDLTKNVIVFLMSLNKVVFNAYLITRSSICFLTFRTGI